MAKIERDESVSVSVDVRTSTRLIFHAVYIKVQNIATKMRHRRQLTTSKRFSQSSEAYYVGEESWRILHLADGDARF